MAKAKSTKKEEDFSQWCDLDPELIPTGILPLDVVLGGGFPRGDMIELASKQGVGKSTTFLHLCKNLLAKGEDCLLLDSERGVKGKTLIPYGLQDKWSSTWDTPLTIFQPPVFGLAEQMIETGITKGKKHVFIDSCTSLLPDGQESMSIADRSRRLGESARFEAMFLSKLKAQARMEGLTVWIINQTRASFDIRRGTSEVRSSGGCKKYDTQILLEDGSTECIGKIVEEKLPVKVMSYNFKTGCFQSKRITAYHNNGKKPLKEWRNVLSGSAYQNYSSKKRYYVGGNETSTGNHSYFIDEYGTEEILDRTKIAMTVVKDFTDFQKQVILGASLSDSYVGMTHKGRKSFTFLQSEKHKPYFDYVYSLFSQFNGKVRENISGYGSLIYSFGLYISDISERFLSRYYDETKPKKQRQRYSRMLEDINIVGLAHAFMGDGSLNGTEVRFNFHSWRRPQIEYFQKILKRRFGVDSAVQFDKRQDLRHGDGLIVSINKSQGSDRLLRMMSPYIIPFFRYKLGKEEPSMISFKWDSPAKFEYGLIQDAIEVRDARHHKRLYRKKNYIAFDIEVEGNHNYIADGFLVHNSACQFFPDMKIMLREGPIMKRKEDTLQGAKDVVYGNEAWVWAQKNRNERPFIEISMPIIYGRGVSNVLFLKGVLQRNDIVTGGGGGFFKVSQEVPGAPEETLRGTGALMAYIKSSYNELVEYCRDHDYLKITKGEIE